jgi:hypothetical protein
MINNLLPPINSNQKLLLIIPWTTNIDNHVLNNLPATIIYNKKLYKVGVIDLYCTPLAGHAGHACKRLSV